MKSQPLGCFCERVNHDVQLRGAITIKVNNLRGILVDRRMGFEHRTDVIHNGLHHFGIVIANANGLVDAAIVHP